MKQISTERYKVSVIIPFYNRIPFVLESVVSVKNQTHKNWELLLINDGSTDELDDLRKLISGDQRIILLEQENKGVSAARNLGIRKATGEYIAFLDSDDLWRKEKLEYQLTSMIFYGYCFSHTDYQRMDVNGVWGEIINSSQQRGRLYPNLISNCGIATPTVMIRSNILKEMEKPFSEQFHIGEDICLWIDLSYRFEFGGIAQPLTLVRVGKTSAAIDYTKQEMGLTNILNYVNADVTYRYEAMQINALWRIIEDNRRLEYKKRENNPLVSIIIPVYNGANYMRDAIDSALAQTYKNIEVLVINDGSDDQNKTEQIALKYGNRVRYFHKENGGVATALNFGIENMRGEYFSWLSHDDMYCPEKIEREVKEVLRSGDKTTIVAGGYKVVNANCENMYSVNMRNVYTEKQLSIPLFGLLHGGVHGCALLIHRSHFDRVGMFDPALLSTQDYDLWFRMFRYQHIFFYDGEYVLSRWHDEQGSKKIKNHLESCNELWINMLQNITEAERCQIDGSSAAFYKDIKSFLQANTKYTDAIEYAEEQEKIYSGKKNADSKDLLPISSTVVLSSNEDLSEWQEEVYRMQNSFSWRVTKPLRLVKKTFVFLMRNGIKATWIKICNKLKKHMTFTF